MRIVFLNVLIKCTYLLPRTPVHIGIGCIRSLNEHKGKVKVEMTPVRSARRVSQKENLTKGNATTLISRVVANLLKICNVYYIICQLLSNLVIYLYMFIENKITFVKKRLL